MPSASVANSALQGGGAMTVSAGAGLSGGGTVPLGGVTTLSLSSVGAGGTYGSAGQVPVITTDAYGRVTAVTTSPIAGAASQGTAGSIAMFTGSGTPTAITGNSIITQSSTGKVGIGTATPIGSLDVSSSTGGFVAAGANLDPKQFSLVPIQNTGKLLEGWNLSAGGGETDLIANRGAGGIGGFNFYDYSNTGALTSLLTLSGGGNVGIGTTSPSAMLEVAGNIKLTATKQGSVIFQDGSTQSTAYTLAAAALDSALAQSNGDIGIGTGSTIPGQLLQVGSTYSQSPSIMVGGHDSNNSSMGTEALLFGAWRDIEPTITSGIVATPTWTCCGGFPATGAGSYPGIRDNTLGFYTIYDPASPSAYSPNMFIATSGNVGIGTSTPGSTLEVQGSVTLTKNSGASITFQDGSVQSTAWNGTTAGGDYAESIDVEGDRSAYHPGDVISIDPSSSGQFKKTESRYSRMVAGVYSTRPGVVGRRVNTPSPAAGSDVPLALVGIVPIHVCTENGVIKPGDFLVSATTPGYAMKGTDESLLSGAIIGKALGSLQDGEGIMEVLLGLR